RQFIQIEIQGREQKLTGKTIVETGLPERFASVREGAHQTVQILVASEDYSSAATCSMSFAVHGGEGSDISESAYGLSLDLCAVGLGTIFNHFDPVLSGNGQKFVHRRRGAAGMNEHHGAGLGCQAGAKLVRPAVVAARHRVHEGG